MIAHFDIIQNQSLHKLEQQEGFIKAIGSSKVRPVNKQAYKTKEYKNQNKFHL
jgi:hypothetical protein